MSRTLAEAKRLHDLGFGILWIKRKSKVPVKSGWTTGSREPWIQLEKEYQTGFNVGVRLGKASKIGGLYLSALDLDCKSTDPKHRKELYEKLKELVPELPEKSTRVLTGRQNGSAHIYNLTKEPVIPRRLAQSSEKVEVKISASKPSKDELQKLSKEKIAAGWRLRAAWEIALMGEGQQILVPPSLHQDTGSEYRWDIPLTGFQDLAQVYFEDKSKDESASVKNDFKLSPVDLFLTNIPKDIIAGIEEGENVEDRSSFIFKAAIAMVRENFTDNEIATSLTDPDTFIGRAAFEHAKTESRARAAQWIIKYSVVKARREADASLQFDHDVETIFLSDEEAELQKIELLTPIDWRNDIERVASGNNAGKPKNTLDNVMLILRNAVNPRVFIRNEFAGCNIYGVQPPWKGSPNAEIQDIDVVRIKAWFATHYRFEPSNDRICEAISRIADENCFHPVRNYFKTLPEWDGTPRVDIFFEKYFSATGPTEYLRAVSRKFLVAMIARIMRPGTKFDQVVILEGDQGIGKSTALRVLAGDDWFTDAHVNVADKDGVLAMKAVWLVEFGELANMRKADVDLFKEFISRTTDRIRLPYGKLPESFPRQCVFVGTTNSSEYLKDLTGNRRFWPIMVGACLFHLIKADRDQIFAEAKFIYDNLDEPLYLEDKLVNQMAMQEQSNRVFHDTLIEKLNEYLSQDHESFPPGDFSTRDIFTGPLIDMKEDRANQMRVAEALKFLGYTKVREFSGLRRHLWRRPVKAAMNGKDHHESEKIADKLTQPNPTSVFEVGRKNLQ